MSSDQKHDCEHCRAFDLYLSTCSPFDDRLWLVQWKKGKELYLSHCEEYKAYKARTKKAHVGNGTHRGLWAGTLTMPPEHASADDMIKAIRKLMVQRSCPVKRYAWYMEYTAAGTPHVHFIYETDTGGRIEAKHFKRAWPLWNEKLAVGNGHQGGYHKQVYDVEAYKAYISKDGGLSDSSGF